MANCSQWPGTGPERKELGSEFIYDLTNYYLSNGHRYEIRFKVGLADGESAD